MTNSWLTEISDMVAEYGSITRVSIIQAKGSTPREIGTAMMVSSAGFIGTIGGGTLEHEALTTARAVLSATDNPCWHREVRDYPLGPSLGQCCGGYVRLMFEIFTAMEVSIMADALSDSEKQLALRPLESGQPILFTLHRKDDSDSWPLPVRRAVREIHSGTKKHEAVLIANWFIEPIGTKRTPLFLYGAGHVGRAVVKTLADLPFEIFWVDTAASRYPDDISPNINKLIARNPASVVEHAPGNAFHVVMSYSHAIDFDVCRAVLAHNDFAYLGVIASKTKRVRFARRLMDQGLSASSVARMNAPIGLPGLSGKEPAIIALSLAADLLLRLQEMQSMASDPETEKIMEGS